MMAVMTAYQPLPVAPAGVEIGWAAVLVEDTDGGRVYLHGNLSCAWDADDVVMRRLAAVQLVRTKAARTVDVAAGFGVDPDTVARWAKRSGTQGVAGLVPEQRGPKGPSKLHGEVVAEIRRRSEGKETNRAIGRAMGVSEASVRRALLPNEEPVEEPDPAGAGEPAPADDQTVVAEPEPVPEPEPELPVLPDPVPRTPERALARAGVLQQAPPVFHPAARVPLAGLFLGLPALAATGLLDCAKQVYQGLPAGFYGLDAMLIEGVLRCLAGEPRAEGATRIDPFALGRVLGLDRAPEVKTIRRKISHLAGRQRAEQLLTAMAQQHLTRYLHEIETAGVVLYVDGHVRAYQGTRKIAKTHAARLKFPAPATVETWVSDAHGDPVLVVMAEPAASLASELRRLLPTLRQAVGDQRRVLVGFDRGGWSPALFAHMDTAGFDTLTWRKQPAPTIDGSLFAEVTFTDDTGLVHTWQAADTRIDLPVDDRGGTFSMRQVTRLIDTKTGTRQAHLVTTRTDLPVGEVLYRMGSRWRQENYFRYARMHFALDAHDSYTATADDPDRMVPNPAKKTTRDTVNNARAHLDRVQADTDALLLDWHTPPAGPPVVLSNTDYNRITANLRDAEQALATAQAANAATWGRLPLGQVNPDQQILDVETKLVTHAIRIAAFNTITTLARDLRVHTGYARAGDEAHTLISQALQQSGDIIPGHGVLTIRLDPLPTNRATQALAELCEHLTATQTRYPATNLTLRYETKTRH
jgi:transposase